jgi:hypothetical protein
MIGGKPYVVEGTLLRYEDFGQQLGNGWYIVAATVNGKPRDDGGYVFYDKNWHEPNRPMTLLSDAPAAAPLAADRTKCRWYCGMTMNAIYEDDRQVILGEKFHAYDPRTNADQRWCSAACRDARLPPLAAQPAETAHDECCEPGCSTSCPARKPAPQPAPACAHGCSDVQANTACPTHGKPVTAKDDFWFTDNEGKKSGPFSTGLEADSAGVDYRNWMAAQSGTPYTGPERLERPKLAHSYGVEDPALENA